MPHKLIINKNLILFVFFCIFSLSLSGQSLTITSPNGNEFWQVGKNPSITWNSAALTSNIVLEYSIDNGNSWLPIATVSNATNNYSWIIPNAVSIQCLVRAKSDAVIDASDANFEISNDNSSCNIVILGSSTAYGTGASSLANSWAGLFSTAIFQKNTKLNVINLATPGLTTYQILATGTTLPIGVVETIDVNRNITKALTYNPVAIIVNMPSNDTNKDYSTVSQLDNYAALNTTASNNSVPIWITTTQPRNSFDTAHVQTQIDVRDGILSTYLDKAINFWDGIADIDGKILASLDFGDGIHVIDEGHNILFNKVLNKNIDALTCLGGSLGINDITTYTNTLKIYPNPAKDYININFKSESSGNLNVEFYDVLGRKLLEKNASFNTGPNSIPILLKEINSLRSQFIFGTLTFKTDSNTIQKSIKLLIN